MKRKIIISEEQVKNLTTLLEQKDIDPSIVRAYSFDWDDNIMNMPTTINMVKDGEPIEVPTDEFAHVRSNPKYSLADNAFDNFIDDDKFMGDLEVALKTKSFAPSFGKFKEALIYANPISIITARGHNPSTLRHGMDLVIADTFSEDELSDMLENIQERMPETADMEAQDVLEKYLDSHEYHPVSSKAFAEKFGGGHGSASNPEHNKKLALRDYVTKVVDGAYKMVSSKYNKLSVGFSDDDLGNVNAMIGYIEGVLQHEFPDVTFIVYDTSEGGNKKIVVKKA